MSETVIKIENLKKQYRLGTIGGGTLTADIQSWWARKRGKDDPNTKLDADSSQYGSVFYALNGINLEIHKGEAVGIIGTNGAGKSTLLKVLSRVTAPTEGKIGINGRIASMLEVGTGFHPELTGRENIYMNGAILGMSRAEIDSKIEDIIEFSECRQFIDTPVKRYSSGMYVKLAFSVAAHLDAEIMIMDEVLAVGDVKFQQKCLGKMSDSSKEDGKTVLYVSHNMSTIKKLCTRCIVLDKGKVIFDGDVDKAIQIYIGEANNNLNSCYYLKDDERSASFLGKKMKIVSLHFLDGDLPIFEENSRMRLVIKVKAYQDIKNARFYFPLKTYDDEPVALIETQEEFEIKENQEKTFELDVDLKGLVAGTYFIKATTYSCDDLGAHESFDQPATKIWFEIKPSKNRKGLNHNRVFWGNLRIDDIIMKEIDND